MGDVDKARLQMAANAMRRRREAPILSQEGPEKARPRIFEDASEPRGVQHAIALCPVVEADQLAAGHRAMIDPGDMAGACPPSADDPTSHCVSYQKALLHLGDLANNTQGSLTRFVVSVLLGFTIRLALLIVCFNRGFSRLASKRRYHHGLLSSAWRTLSAGCPTIGAGYPASSGPIAFRAFTNRCA